MNIGKITKSNTEKLSYLNSLLEGADYDSVETFNFERKLINLEQFGDAITITPVITSIKK
ncbi:hypothetical protein [Pseudoalteromonas sp. bablab_jr011]|uniref:hypothetical protein n=1 Tax=Pseudoalteromonas sp. bablab_jr011 TaxID=2755062 RepID=UPI0018F51E96|nr:hypothetical protein [Pseudoalteromonas sp. bablab_jr011]